MLPKRFKNIFLSSLYNHHFSDRQKANVLLSVIVFTITVLVAVIFLNMLTAYSTHPVLISGVNTFFLAGLFVSLLLLRRGKYNASALLSIIVLTLGVAVGVLLKFSLLIKGGFNNYTYFMFGVVAFATFFGKKRWQLYISIFYILLNIAAATVAFTFFEPENPAHLVGTTINIVIALLIVMVISERINSVAEASLKRTEDELEKNMALSKSHSLKIEELARANEDLEQANEELEAMYEEQQAMNEELEITSQELEESNETLMLFKRFAEASSNMLFITRLDGTVIYTNPAFSREILGEGPLSTTAMKAMSFYRDNSWKRLESEIFSEVMVSGQWKGELPVYSLAAEREIETIQNISLLRDSHNVPAWFATIITDITYQKHVEREIFRSENRLKNILDTANEGFLEIDREEIIVDANRELAKILGYDLEEMIGRSYRDLMESSNRQIFDRHRLLRDEGKASAYELLFERKDKTTVPCLIKGTPLMDQNGEMTGAFGLVTDLTDRKKLEMQLLLSQKMEAVGTLAGGIAHDFNNLLTAICGYSQLLMTQISEEDNCREYVEEISKAADRSGSLTRQLLAFSRRQMLNRKVFSICHVIKGMQTMLRRIIGENYSLTIRYKDDCFVDADYGQIEQVIMNMVINARDAMPSGGAITISIDEVRAEETREEGLVADEEGDMVRVRISDTGVGMTEEVMQKIFDPFFTTKDVGEGTGLGLAVAYGIIEQHGGKISVRSEKGTGSEFTLLFPRSYMGETKTGREKKAQQPAGGAGEKILLVEDQEEVKKFASMALEKNGYHVLSVSSIGEARNLFEEEEGEFDVVFSDVVLPDGNGPGLVDELKEKNPDLKVLLSSGYTDKKARWEHIRERGYYFLAKPYTLDDLLAAMHEVIVDGKRDDKELVL